MSPTASSSRSSRSPKPDTEVDAEGVVLALEPAAAEAEDEPALRQVVDGRGELRGEARVAERVGGHEQAEADVLRQDGKGRQRRPALHLGVGRVALVGEEVIVDPEGVPAGTLRGQAGVAQVRPVRPVDPECRAEPHESLRSRLPRFPTLPGDAATRRLSSARWKP